MKGRAGGSWGRNRKLKGSKNNIFKSWFLFLKSMALNDLNHPKQKVKVRHTFSEAAAGAPSPSPPILLCHLSSEGKNLMAQNYTYFL